MGKGRNKEEQSAAEAQGQSAAEAQGCRRLSTVSSTAPPYRRPSLPAPLLTACELGILDAEVRMSDVDLPLNAWSFKVGDFDGCAPSSRAQTPVQTPQWMAPEVVRLEG